MPQNAHKFFKPENDWNWMTMTNCDSTRVLDSIAMVVVSLLHVLENLETKLWNNIMLDQWKLEKYKN